MRQNYNDRLFSIRDNAGFEKLALDVFRYQLANNNFYAEFVNSLRVKPESVQSIYEIPFLPAEFYKTHEILSGDENYQRIFISSGTTGQQSGVHYIKDVDLYETVFTDIFSSAYGNPAGYTILALLPSYLEREGSSLIYMMEKLINGASQPDSGFYLHDHEKLFILLTRLQKQKTKTLLFGVTYALLDFIKTYELSFPDLIVMETGGMKGRRKEMIREEVHALLCKGFGVKSIHSEYGMTEILSQAYSKGSGIFVPPSWMRILIRDPYDPLKPAASNASGGINIIDLANIDSCSFISTQDLGRVYQDNSFEVLGRFDFSDVRGCNLLIE